MPIGEGHGAVRLTDTSGNVAAFDTSGRITIAGGSITASISGDTVITKFSGQGVWVSGSISTLSGSVVGVSGETVIAKVSGETINFSGQAVSVSGNVVVAASGLRVVLMNSAGTLAVITTGTSDSLSTASQYLITATALYGFREGLSTSGFARLRVTESGQNMSGINYKLAVDFSGSVASISGNVVTVSGNAVNMAGAVVTAPTWVAITGASGGTTLASQACTMVRLMNLSGNGTMLVGGTGTAAPVSGTKGIMLWPGSLSVQGTEMDFPVNNANLLAVVAHTSGNTLAYMTFG